MLRLVAVARGPKVLLSAVVARGFHAAPVVLAGRKTGSSALEQTPRPFSKKQKRRQKAKIERKADRVFPHKDKMKAEFAAKRMDSPGMESFISGLQESLGNVIPELLKPSEHKDMLGLEASARGDDSAMFLPVADADDILRRFLTTAGRKAADGEIKALKVSSGPSEELTLALESVCFSEESILGMHKDTRAPSKTAFKDCDAAVNMCVSTLQAAAQAGKPLGERAYVAVMKSMLRHGQRFGTNGKHPYLLRAKDTFAAMALAGVDTTPRSWECLIESFASMGMVEEAVARIDGLLDVGVRPTRQSYEAVQVAYVRARQWEKLDAFWLRMKDDGVDLAASSFHPVMKMCSKTGQAERAVFLLDELTAMRLEPDRSTFNIVLRAMAEAPHHVQGYEDIIFEVMGRFEGMEIVPDAFMYSSIIYAFGRAGDGDAAMFYFDEMKRKGIEPTDVVYNNVLYALSRHQAVGVQPYGYRGRWAQPRELIGKNEEEEAMISIGNEKATELLTRGLTFEGEQFSSKGVRKKPVETDHLLETAGDAGVYGDTMMQDVREEAEREGSWRLDEMRRREEEAYQLRRQPSYPGFYQPDRLDQDQDEVRVLEGGGAGKGCDYGDDDGDEGDYDDDDDGEQDEGYQRGTMSLPDGEGGFADVDLLSPEEYMQEMKEAGMWDEDEEGGGEGDDFEEGAGEGDVMRLASDLDSLIAGEPITDRGEGPSGMGGGGQALGGLDALMSELNLDSLSLDEQWAMVEFGRAGDPDYDDNLFHERWPTNKRRAMQVFAEYDEKHNKCGSKGGVAKSRSKGAARRTLNAYLGVFAEAKDREAAYDVLAREFTARGQRADEHTYKHLVRMHVRRGEIEEAQAMLDTARAEKLRPQPDSFGIVIHSLSKRNMVVEALKVLEEAAYAKVRVPERHLRDLRRVCRKLGVKHPDMPVDPTLWLQEMKAARHKLKGTGFKRVQGLRSKTAW